MLNIITQTEIYETKDEQAFAVAQKRLADAGIAMTTWSNPEQPMVSCCGGAEPSRVGRKDGELRTVSHIAVKRSEAARAREVLTALLTS